MRDKYNDFKDEDPQFNLDQYAKTLYQVDGEKAPATSHANKKTPAETAMKNVIDTLQSLGWEFDGYTMVNQFRISTANAPVYGGIGGKLVTTGGRLRLKRGNYRVTIGKKSTCFYARKDHPDGRMVTIPTKDLIKILETESEFKDK